MAQCKVLTVGSVLGAIHDLVEKVKLIDTKHGKFELLICTGDFFGPESEGASDLDDLLANKFNIPMQTYITQGDHPIPARVVEQADAHNGRICNGITLLGKSSVLNTSHGYRIACIGGSYQEENFASEKGLDLRSNHLTSDGLKHLFSEVQSSRPEQTSPDTATNITTPLVDILLTHQWPISVTALSLVPLPGESSPQTIKPLDDVVSTLKPRYHFVSQSRSFWEREPFVWEEPGHGLRVTRFIALGSFGQQDVSQKKQRWFYAFNLGASAQAPTKPKNATKNPFLLTSSSGLRIGEKRVIDEAPKNYIWGSSDSRWKRPRLDNQEESDQLACRRCQSPGHTAHECPKRDKPPEGYICRKCNEPGHFIRDCSQLVGPKKPKEGYTCRACGSGEHYIRDCPTVRESGGAVTQHHDGSRAKGPPKEIRPDECWFCLSNPRVAKHLIVSIGTECYVTLPKGQLYPTGPKHELNEHQGPLPGGGHVLIVPIEHHSTMHTLPLDAQSRIITEINKTKEALKACFAEHNAGTVSFEMARVSGKGGHAHIQVIAIPTSLCDRVEEAFKEESKISWENDPEDALTNAQRDKSSYFRVDLPNGKKMIHIIQGYFDLQFGRTILSKLLDMPERSDWKKCSLSEEEEQRDAQIFKEVFVPYDPSIVP